MRSPILKQLKYLNTDDAGTNMLCGVGMEDRREYFGWNLFLTKASQTRNLHAGFQRYECLFVVHFVIN